MTPNSPQAAAVKTELDKLIKSATNADFDILDKMYHTGMSIYMFGPDKNLHVSDKPAFIEHVKKSADGAKPPSDWAKYHLVEADEARGHVLISRKVDLTGTLQIVTLSIDFVFEDGRWQIIREVIFTGTHPE